MIKIIERKNLVILRNFLENIFLEYDVFFLNSTSAAENAGILRFLVGNGPSAYEVRSLLLLLGKQDIICEYEGNSFYSEDGSSIEYSVVNKDEAEDLLYKIGLFRLNHKN